MLMISVGSVAEWVIGSFVAGFLSGSFLWAYLYTKMKRHKKHNIEA